MAYTVIPSSNSALIDHRNDVKMFKTFLVPGASLIFHAVNAFQVTWCKRRSKAVSRAFSSDTSPKCIDREGLGNSRTGIRQVCNHELQASGFTANFEHFGVISLLSISLYTTDHVCQFFFFTITLTLFFEVHFRRSLLKKKRRRRRKNKLRHHLVISIAFTLIDHCSQPVSARKLVMGS